ncbi:uncharacterized protein LOC142924033 [Petromyzon marinus]|uniref:uncharacterized protein LOC142924033 n=1 Tax=Petromyzon marinus TaxID=7757 RepID=UPI003F70CD1E
MSRVAATANKKLSVASHRQTVRVWCSDTGQCLHTFHAGAPTSATAAAVAGRASLDGGATGSDASRRAAPPALRRPWAAGAAVSAVSCAGEWLASGAGATLQVHHLPTRRLVWSSTAAASTKQVASVLLLCGARPGPCQDGFTSPSPSPLLVSAWSDGEVRCHSLDLDGLSPRVHSLRGDGAGVTSVAGHTALLVAGCRDGTVRLWDFSAPQ